MSDVIDLKKHLNHKWKSDPVFIEGFDYEKPEFAEVPDGLKWALPIHESVNKPEEVQRQKRVQEVAKNDLESEPRASRLNSQKLLLLKDEK